MASYVPIVASSLPSILEVLNNKNAVLVEPENKDSLVSGIKILFGDKLLSDTLAKKAYNDVGNYTWQARGIKITEFINKNIK